MEEAEKGQRGGTKRKQRRKRMKGGTEESEGAIEAKETKLEMAAKDMQETGERRDGRAEGNRRQIIGPRGERSARNENVGRN